MLFWKKGSRGRDRDSSSASESGDSPTSTSSPQSQIPSPPETNHSSQPSSSRRNERDHPAPAVAAPATTSYDSYDVAGRPVQIINALDYQPPQHRGLPPPSTSSKGIYNMQGPPRNNNADWYTRNALDSFKFGSPSFSTITDNSSQVDPLSSEEEFNHPGADTTPRPSLAIPPEAHHRSIRSEVSPTNTFGMRSTSTPSLVTPSGNGHSQTGQQETHQDQSLNNVPRLRYHPPPYLDSMYASSSLSTSSTREEDYYFDEDDFSDPDIDVSSARPDDAGSFDQSHWYPPSDQDSFAVTYLPHRRGSNPIPIPGAQQDGHRGRDREDSVNTLRSAPGPSTMAANSQVIAPNAVSLPENGIDWDQRRRAIQDWAEPPIGRSHPPIHAIDYAVGPSTQAGNDNVASDFDMAEWGGLAGGIKGGAELGNVDAAFEMGSGGPNIFRSIFGPNDAPRRPSIAPTVNDPFNKHALAYMTGHDWSFYKDKADGPASSGKRRFVPFNERSSSKGQGGPPWRGMDVGATEYWRNDITGVYKVERLEIHASESRAPQQRLLIHHHRDGSRQPQRPILGLPYDPHNGPTATVHKHSKAAAFSLSRHYRDKSQQSKAADRRGTSRAQPLRNAVYINGKKTAMILLAPRKVQEAYTSTTTTRKLESHGLLDDTPRSRDADRRQKLIEKEEKLRRSKERAKLEKEKAKKDKGKGKALRSQDSAAQSDIESGLSGLGPSTPQSQPTSASTSVSPAHIASEISPHTPSNARIPASPGPSVSSSSNVVAPTSQGSSTSSNSNATVTALQARSISSSSSLTVPVAESNPSPLLNKTPPTSRSSNIPSPSDDITLPSETRNGSSSRLIAPPLQASDRNIPSEHTLVSPGDTQPWSSNHSGYGEGEEEYIDEEDEELGLIPKRRKRTPHNEAYHSLSPESIDSFASQQDTHSRSFLPWLGGRSNASSRNVGNPVDVPYNPPWLSAPSRPHNHELQMQVVAGLNSSFQGVGLLPTDKEVRESRRRKAMKNQARIKGERQYIKEKDIFIDLPDEALYMLLPLWPSETDPVSTRDYPFQMPTIPISQRLYALVYYKPYYPPPENTKSQNKDKSKKSRGSPTASHDGIYIDDRNVLMSQFYIGARIVAYDDLEGSNVRVPELGLSVIGPLGEAFETIPINTRPPRSSRSNGGKAKEQSEGKEFWDFIIGSYHSREHPIEFYPEGFKKMGLATQPAEDPETEFSAVSSDVNDAGPSGSNEANHSASSTPGSSGAGPSDSDSPRDLQSNNASTSSLPSITGSRTSSGNSSRVDLDKIAPFGEPGPSDAPAPATRLPPGEEDEIQEPPIILTPIGRAVLEMALMGGLAVTSFTPQNYAW